ncbi:hypothetical protein CW304_00630 [Bacillus sp. UFRGS-B20]|nr:hypothetical protein CW304_00630 [Bacillus sp. UFRGS-B20]
MGVLPQIQNRGGGNEFSKLILLLVTVLLWLLSYNLLIEKKVEQGAFLLTFHEIYFYITRN